MNPLPIRADGVAFRYAGAERPALRDVAFDVAAGSVLLVVGPSGSGKSTLARAVAGLVPGEFPGEWAGSLRVGDLEASDASRVAVAALVGIVFQDPASQLVMDRVADDVAFGLENRGWPLAAMRRRVPVALASVGLSGFETRRSNRLSGGEQQRLALAGALAPEPGILVLDEPTANLDPEGTAAVFEQIAALKHGGSATIVLVEHRVELAWPLADLVLALGADGRSIDFGAPDAVLARSRASMALAGIWLPEDRTVLAPGGQSSGVRSPRANGRGDEPTTLELRDARYTFEHELPALRDADLEVRSRERVAIVGPNGSGKTTLLRLAAGLIRPQAGSVSVLGVDPARLPAPELARMVGFVHQDPELGFLADTVAEEVALGLDPDEVGHANALATVLGLALDRFGGRSPYSLSGGEQRRLSLVTALARQPALLLLDEPTYGQDRHGHEALVGALRDLVAEGSTVIAATHDERFVADVATRRVELADGWIVDDEPFGAAAR